MARYVTINSKVKLIVRRGAPGPASATADPTFDSITMNTGASVPAVPVQGQYWWDADEETISFKQNGTTLQLGQETQANIRNVERATLLDATPAMAVGSIGASGRITVEKMDGTLPVLAKALFGIATEDIGNNDDGKITNFGKIRGVNTSGIPYGETWLDGDILWISDTTAGTLTNIEPPRTSLGMPVGFVIYSHATAGSIFVRITPLDEHLLVTPDQRDALDSANTPTASNAFATMAAVIDYTSPISVTGAESIPSINKGKNHVCTGTTADYTVSLPTTGLTSGDLFSFEMSAALTEFVTIDALSGQLIDGQQTRVMWAGEKAVLKWDGTNWQKLNIGGSIPMVFNAYLGTNDVTGFGGYHPILLDSEFKDSGLVFNTSNGRFTPRRSGTWNFGGRGSVSSGIAITRVIGKVFNFTDSTDAGLFFDISGISTLGIRATGTVQWDAVVAKEYDFRLLVVGGGSADTYLGDTAEFACGLWGTEIVEW